MTFQPFDKLRFERSRHRKWTYSTNWSQTFHFTSVQESMSCFQHTISPDVAFVLIVNDKTLTPIVASAVNQSVEISHSEAFIPQRSLLKSQLQEWKVTGQRSKICV